MASSTYDPRKPKLEGKIAVITGSSEGIGFAIARRLAQDGAHVVISSRSKDNVDNAVKKLKSEGLKCSGTVCHVGNAEQREKLIEQTAKEFGGIDILVSNVATNPAFGTVLDCNEDQWEKIMDINVKASFLLAKSVIPHMEKRGGGSIVFISSVAGYALPYQVFGAYGVSKSALLSLVKAMCQPCADAGIRVNGVAPGLIKTNFSGALWENEAVLDVSVRRIPLRRFGMPDEVSGIVAFLCSDEASYITGENVVVAGGLQSRL